MCEWGGYMKRIVVLWLSCFVLLGAKVDINIENNKSAIICLGKELASIRNMLEIYAQITGGIKYKLPKERLRQSLEELEVLLDALGSRYGSDAIVTSSTKSARVLWKPVKKILENALVKNVDRKTLKRKVVYVHDHIRGTIKNISKMKAHIIEISNINHIAEINAALEIGASSRRLSAHYMMKLLDVNDPTIEKHYQQGLKRYAEALHILKASKPSQKTLDMLRIFEKRLHYFKNIWNMHIFTPALVVKKANEVFFKSTELAYSIR